MSSFSIDPAVLTAIDAGDALFAVEGAGRYEPRHADERWNTSKGSGAKDAKRCKTP